jgi:polar amino acid transport system substrate-binding protein
MENEPQCCNSWRRFIALCVVAAGALFSPLSSACVADEARNERLRERLASGVLRWGGDAEGGAPFQYRDEDARTLIGFEVEIADALAEHLSRQLGRTVGAEFVQFQWDSLPSGLLETKNFDIIISGLEITAENRQKILFTRPYYIYAQQLVVRRDEERIRNLDDCHDKEVGTLAGSAAMRLLQQKGVGKITDYDGQIEPYRDLAIGRLDAVLLDMPIAIFHAQHNPNLKFAGKRVGRGEYGIGLRPDDTDLAAALNDALSELMVSGALARVYRKWKIWNDDQPQLAREPRLNEELYGLLGLIIRDGQPVPAVQEVEEVDTNTAARLALAWSFDRYAPLLLHGAGMTVFLTVCSMAVAMLIGLVVALCRMYGFQPLSWLALGYVEFFRGVPLLLLLTFLYFGLPSMGVQMPAITAAIIGFGINYAAYEAEIYRSAIQAVPLGQWEAGRALGMKEATTFRRIIFPQAFRTALGPMTNDFVAMFKDTSLVSVIAVHELTKEYNILARSSLKFVEIGLLTALLYLAMSVPLGYLSRYLEKRWSPGR